MAATLYSYGVSTIITDIKAALNAKGLITLVKYENATNLIFTTPLTSKVIKIAIENANFTQLLAYYGDAWTSTTTITNQVQFGNTVTSDDAKLTGFDIIADTNFFAIIWKTGTTAAYGVTYVGQLENGDDLVFAFTNILSTGNVAKNLTTEENLYPITLYTVTGAKDSTGKLFTIPLMWTNSAGAIQMNGTAIGGTTGIKLSSSIFNGATSVFIGSNYYLTPATLFFTTAQTLYTSLLLEFTP